MSASHRMEVRVYFEDTDFSGFVYHASYLRFMERGRTEFLRAAGFHHADLQARGLVFAVRQMEVRFDAPARIDDLLTLETSVVTLSGARLGLDQTVRRDDLTLAAARVVVALLTTAGRPARMPKELLSRFAAA